MGYSTDFHGSFELDTPLDEDYRVYLCRFSETRRIRRNAELTAQRPDPARKAVGLPVGEEGGYFVGAEGMAGQEHSDDVLEYNEPPQGQPGFWCQWKPSEDGSEIAWDGGEKFYEADAWLVYLIEHFLKPWGYVLEGRVEASGEDMDDRWAIVVKANRVFVCSYELREQNRREVTLEEATGRWVDVGGASPFPLGTLSGGCCGGRRGVGCCYGFKEDEVQRARRMMDQHDDLEQDLEKDLGDGGLGSGRWLDLMGDMP